MNDMVQPAAETVDVLIVGGGPVGLSLAMELGLRGISALLVEKRPRTGAQPRAKTTNARSMTHMRRWGLAERLRDRAPLPRDYPTDVVFATRLYGRELVHFRGCFAGSKVRDDRFPEPMQWVPQYTVEEVLHTGLAKLPSVRITFDTTLEAATEDAGGIDAVVGRPDGSSMRVRARYLVGADGARSTVRGLIGAKMEGQHAFGHNFNVIIRAPDLRAHPPAERAIMYWLVNPESPCVMSPMDDDKWAFGRMLPPGVTEMSDEEIHRLVDLAVGRHLEFEIVERDLWAAHRLIASTYRRGRMVLAGDACHLHPPFGGFGMNLGIADGVDLGWKLAAILQGWGGEALLDSYEAERRAVHLRTIDQAVKNYSLLTAHLIRDALDEDTEEGARVRAQLAAEIETGKQGEFYTLGIVLGSRYEDSPIIVDDGSAAPAEDVTEYVPSAHPGCLAPHAWLDATTSLYDRLGRDFTLLVLGEEPAGAVARFEAAARASGMPLAVLRLPAPEFVVLYGAHLALVRPDQFVAWRGDAATRDIAALLDVVRGAAPVGLPAQAPAAREMVPS